MSLNIINLRLQLHFPGAMSSQFHKQGLIHHIFSSPLNFFLKFLNLLKANWLMEFG